jgi:peptide/nickel transport system substrate-binding protein
MRRLATLAIVLVTAWFTPQAALAEPHVLNFSDGLDLTGLNPLQPQAAPNYEIAYLTMAYLTRYGPAGLQPELLDELPTQRDGTISLDGKTIRLKLKPDLKWADGQPLTSADIAFTIATINDPKTISQYKDGFQYITGVDTPDPATAVVHLSQPYGQALRILFSSRSAPVLPKHLLAGADVNTAPYNQLPVGAGPFRMTKWTRGDRVEMERNPFYANGTPKLERIVYHMIPTVSGAVTALRTGEVDTVMTLAYSDYKPYENDPTIKAIVMRGVRPGKFTLNVKRPALADIAVRRALRLATDRAGILQRSYFGGGVLSETGVSAVDPYAARIPLVRYDPKAAAALLDRAGWKVGSDGVRVKNGQRLTIELIGGAGSSFVDQILELVRANWSAIGIDVTTKRYPLSLMFGPRDQGGILFGGKFDVALFSTGQVTAAEYADGFECRDIPPNGTNVSQLCDPPLDKLVDRALKTYDPSAAGIMFVKAQHDIFVDTPEIVLTLRNEYYPYRDNVTGAHFSPFAFFYDPLTIDVTK